MHWAVIKGHEDLVDELISRGAQVNIPNSLGFTSFMYAVRLGHEEIVDFFLKNNIDVKMKNKNGNTALHLACINKQQKIGVNILESNPSLMNSVNNDLKTPLHLSAANGLSELTGRLLLHGASVTAEDSEGYTPSLCCAKDKDVASCLSLIESIMLFEEKNGDHESASVMTNGENNSFNELRSSLIKHNSTMFFTPRSSLNNSNSIKDINNSDDFY